MGRDVGSTLAELTKIGLEPVPERALGAGPRGPAFELELTALAALGPRLGLLPGLAAV